MAETVWKVAPPLEPRQEGVVFGPTGRDAGVDRLWLGSLAEVVQGRTPRVWLSTAKEQVVAVAGKRGSGKSFTLGVIAEGLSLQSDRPDVAHTARARGALLFDPLDTYWTTRVSVADSDNPEAEQHYQLAQRAGLYGLTFNVEAWLPGEVNRRSSDPDWFRTLELAVPRLGPDEWELLLDVSVLTDPMGHALVDALQLVSGGYHRGGEHVAPTPAFDLADLLEACEADELTQTYHAETLRALRQRFGSLRATGLFSASGTTPAELVRPGQLSVILLGRLPYAYQTAVVAVVTRMLIEDRQEAAFAEKRLVLDPGVSDEERATLTDICETSAPRTVVALDEAQTFLAPEAAGAARALFVRLVKEGRNMGLSAVLATQQPAALDKRVLSQVETFITHQLVTDADIRAVRENLKSALPEAITYGRQNLDFSGLLRQLMPGHAVVSSAEINTQVRRAVIVAVRPRATVHGGIEL